MQIFEPEDFFKFLSVIDDLRDKCLLETFYYCGLRKSELRSLQWKHIDFKNHTINVCRQVLNPSASNSNSEWYISSTKTESSNRLIPIPDTLLKDLEELRNQNAKYSKFKNTWFVFGDDQPMSYHHMYSRRDKYQKESGVKHIRFHDFRHSFTSALISSNAPITAISNYLGHSDTTETLETYTHLIHKDLENVPKFFDTLEKQYNSKDER